MLTIHQHHDKFLSATRKSPLRLLHYGQMQPGVLPPVPPTWTASLMTDGREALSYVPTP